MKGNKIGKAGCRPLLQEGGYKARDQWHLEADIGLKVKLYLGFFFSSLFLSASCESVDLPKGCDVFSKRLGNEFF